MTVAALTFLLFTTPVDFLHLAFSDTISPLSFCFLYTFSHQFPIFSHISPTPDSLASTQLSPILLFCFLSLWTPSLLLFSFTSLDIA